MQAMVVALRVARAVRAAVLKPKLVQVAALVLAAQLPIQPLTAHGAVVVVVTMVVVHLIVHMALAAQDISGV